MDCCALRSKKTASALPVATMRSACSGSVMRLTAAVGMLASVRMAVAEGSVSSLLVTFLHARILRDEIGLLA